MTHQVDITHVDINEQNVSVVNIIGLVDVGCGGVSIFAIVVAMVETSAWLGARVLLGAISIVVMVADVGTRLALLGILLVVLGGRHIKRTRSLIVVAICSI